MVGSWFRAVELCSTGCTLIGPIEGDLLLAIRDNSLLPSSFDGSLKDVAGLQPQAHRVSSEERHTQSSDRTGAKAVWLPGGHLTGSPCYPTYPRPPL
jgi:hypothetical protein